MANEMQWLDAVNDIDQDTVEVTGPEYPYIQWVNGKPPMKPTGGVIYHGGWFLPEGQVSAAPAAPWAAGELVHDDATATEGFSARDITVAVIRMRRRWYVSATQASYPWNEYDQAKAAGKPSGQAHVLCLVRGLEDVGPMVLTVKGTVCRAFMGSRQSEGVLGAFNRLVIREANALNAKRGVTAKFPYRAFWLVVGPKRDDKGGPVFDEVGTKPNSSLVTLPTAIGLDGKLAAGELAKRFVGTELLATLNRCYGEADAWAVAWDKAKVVETEPAGELDFEQPMNGEDLPF